MKLHPLAVMGAGHGKVHASVVVLTDLDQLEVQNEGVCGAFKFLNRSL